MGTNLRPELPTPDPHFERLHGPSMSYARLVQAFQQAYDSPSTSALTDFPVEASRFSRPTVPNAVDFSKGTGTSSNVPPQPTPGFLGGFQTPCESTCSIVNCGSGCNPSVVGSGSCSLSQCNNLDQCTSEECCREASCSEHSSLPTTRRESIDFSAGDQYASFPSQQQFSNRGVRITTYEELLDLDNSNDDPLQWPWLLPDQECDIIAPTNDALSQQVLHDHVQSEPNIIGSSDYEGLLDAQKLPQDMPGIDNSGQHTPDSYVCLWEACMEMFPDAEQLGTHIKVAHTPMEIIDCRWGGCYTIAANSAELQTHVDIEHLHIHPEQTVSSSIQEIGPSDNRNPSRRKHPLYWSEENDDLLMHARARNISFEQIASQYFPDRTAKACSCRYSRICPQQQPSDPQPTEQSTSLLSYESLQSTSPATSPFGSQYPLVDSSLIQASPAILPNHSSQLTLGSSPFQGDHKCMWITDDTTETPCGALLGDLNALQAHIESSHRPLCETRKRRPSSHWVCKWKGCALKGAPRGSRDKLKKHICTHTGCKSTPVNEKPLQ